MFLHRGYFVFQFFRLFFLFNERKWTFLKQAKDLFGDKEWRKFSLMAFKKFDQFEESNKHLFICALQRIIG